MSKRVKQLTKQERKRMQWEAECRCVNCGADLTAERPGNGTKLCNRCRRHKIRYYKRVVKPKLAKKNARAETPGEKGNENE